jgi:hypothetical protein
MQQQLMPNPEQPPPESEIYPPGATIRRERIWISAGTQGTQRIYVARLGPVGLALLALIVGTMAVLALFLALGAALITVAVGAVLAIGAILSVVVHGQLRRFR